MENFGKALGTGAVWGGVSLLCHILNSSNMLDSLGAGFMVFAAVVISLVIWNN